MTTVNTLIIDLCCGGGVIAEAFEDSLGLDMNRENLEYYPNMKLQGDSTRTPFRSGSVTYAHGSPPYQAFSVATHNKHKHPNIVDPVRKELRRIATKYSIENVLGAPIRNDLMLCQSMFELPGARHRIFELNFYVPPLQCKTHNHILRNKGTEINPARAFFAHTKGSRKRNREFLGCRDLPVKISGLGIPPVFMKYILQYVNDADLKEWFEPLEEYL